jgi:hypothetical protein
MKKTRRAHERPDVAKAKPTQSPSGSSSNREEDLPPNRRRFFRLKQLADVLCYCDECCAADPVRRKLRDDRRRGIRLEMKKKRIKDGE